MSYSQIVISPMGTGAINSLRSQAEYANRPYSYYLLDVDELQRRELIERLKSALESMPRGFTESTPWPSVVFDGCSSVTPDALTEFVQLIGEWSKANPFAPVGFTWVVHSWSPQRSVLDTVEMILPIVEPTI